MRFTLRRLRVLAIAPVAALVSACPEDIVGGTVCTADFRFGINVTVVDSVTNTAPASATLIARSGAYVDSVGPVQAQPSFGIVLPTAGERAGTYDLTVRSTGYRDWTKTGVTVTKGVCHVDQQAFTARLQR